MMGVEAMNKLLERVGSPHRCEVGGHIQETMIEFLDALEKHVAKRLDAIEADLDHMRVWGTLPPKR